MACEEKLKEAPHYQVYITNMITTKNIITLRNNIGANYEEIWKMLRIIRYTLQTWL